MSHPISMIWRNGCATAIDFLSPAIVDGNGTLPVSNNDVMSPNGSATVSADQVGNGDAGPQGTYDWIDTSTATTVASVAYHHPSGHGQTSVTVSCAQGYEVSDDDTTWYASNIFADSSLQQKNATITLYLADAPPGPPLPSDTGLVPLLSDMSNKAGFVNSMFDPEVRTTTVIQTAIQSGALVYSYADETSRGYMLNAWLAAWQQAAGETLTSSQKTDLARCPSQDYALIEFLVSYVKTNALYLSVPSLTLRWADPQGQKPPVYSSAGYSREPFYDATTQAWNYGSYWTDPTSSGAAVSHFLYLLYYGAQMVVVCSSTNRGDGNTVADVKDALEANLPNRNDLGNSHYTSTVNMSGVYYNPKGAPYSPGKDIEVFATSTPPGNEPLIFSFLVGDTAHSNPNVFIQLEGWPGQEPITLTPAGGDRHNADYDENTSTYWNFATYGACAYSEKRSTPVFLANSDFDLTILEATGMPSYVGAGSPQGWMNVDLIVNE